MARSSRDARRPSEDTARAGGSGPPRRSRAAEIDARAVARLIGLAVLFRFLRSRWLWEKLAVGAIVLGALGRIGQENRAGTMARLAAWNKRQVQFLERQAERQSARVERQAERQGKRLIRYAKGPWASGQ